MLLLFLWVIRLLLEQRLLKEIEESNTIISKTHRLLNKMLLSLPAPFFVYCNLCFLRFSQRQSFFSSWTQYFGKLQRNLASQVIIRAYIVMFFRLKMVFSKLSLVRYHCLHNKRCLQYHVFNYRTSTQIFLFYKFFWNS